MQQTITEVLNGRKRFKVKYHNAGGKTNDEIRAEAGHSHTFIMSVTSKILHADEYSVQNHVNEDPLAWFSLILAGSMALRLYTQSIYAQVEA